MKKLIIFMGIIVVILVSGFVYAKGTPQYSLYQFRKAVENHDADTAMKYFDVDSIVDNLMNDFMKAQDEKKPANEFEAMGNNFAKGLMAMMIPTMKETLKGQLKTAITTPSDDKTPLKGIQQGSLSDFEIKTEGKMSIISRKDDIDMKFKMVKTTDGHWKIVQMMMPDAMRGLQR